MIITLTIDGREHTLEWTGGEALSCRLDESPFEAQAAEVGPGVYSLLIGEKSFHVRIEPSPQAGESLVPDSHLYRAQINGELYSIAMHDPRRWSRASSASKREGRQQILAPMPGKVVRVLVKEAQRVEAGQGLIVVEAMKMQNEIKGHAAGTVDKILVSEGQPVTAGETLLTIE